MPRKPKARPPRDHPEKLDSTLNNLMGYVMRRVQMQLTQHLTSCLKEHDIRPAQFTALNIIEQSPGLTQADLPKNLTIEPPQAVLMVNKLKTRGLAMRIRSNPEKRSMACLSARRASSCSSSLRGSWCRATWTRLRP